MVDGSDQPLGKSKVGEMSGALGEVGWRNKGKHRTALGRGWRVRKILILKRKTGCRTLIRARVGNSEDKGVEASGIKDQVLGPSGPEFCSPFGSPFLGSKGTGSGVGPVRPSPRSSPPLTNSGSGVGVGPVSLRLSSPKSADPFGLYPLLARTGLVVKGQDLHLEGKASVSKTGSWKVEELAGISGCASSLSAGSFVVKRLEDSRWFQSRSGSGSAGAVGSLLPGSSHGSQTRASGGDIGGQVLLEDGEFSRSLCGALALAPSGDSFSSPATGRVMPSMSGPRGLEGGGVGFDVRGLDSSVVSPEAGELVESTFMGVDSESRRPEVLAGVCSVGSSGMVGTSDTLEGRRSVPGETGLPTSSSAERAGGLSPLSSGKSLRPASLRPNSFKGCSGFSGLGVGTSSGYPAVLPRACSGVGLGEPTSLSIPCSDMADSDWVDSYGGYAVAFAGQKYAARSSSAFIANSTYIITSFTLVLEFQKGRLQNLYWKRDGCASCSGKSNFVCLNKQDCAIKTPGCKKRGGSVDCSLGIQLAFSGTDKHNKVLNSWYEVEKLQQYSLYGLYSNLKDSLTGQYNKIF
ncbi:hypothetical protein HHK36_017973 [Tetracentron sinense]|uniref:Uncharacterized protein n=1 Tax=Tetracentron sinense TaxID=13715 RepID=A0A834Z0M8_TETSI|nr:hypothetical protein HHK36_017973 [Tetracentron sinense]